MNSGPLTAFGSINNRLARTNDWQTQPNSNNLDRAQESDQRDDLLNQSDEIPADKPVLSPRSFDQFFDELTYTPGADVDFTATPFVVPALAGNFAAWRTTIPPEGGTTNTNMMIDGTRPLRFDRSILSPRAKGSVLCQPNATRWEHASIIVQRAEGPALLTQSHIDAQS